MKPDKKTWISEAEAADMLGVRPRTLRRNAGELNIERSNPLGKYRYVKEDVIKALEKYSSKAA